jgi:hypothetical protein
MTPRVLAEMPALPKAGTFEDRQLAPTINPSRVHCVGADLCNQFPQCSQLSIADIELKAISGELGSVRGAAASKLHDYSECGAGNADKFPATWVKIGQRPLALQRRFLTEP